MKFIVVMWLRLLHHRFITEIFLNGKTASKKLIAKHSKCNMLNSYICGVKPIPMCRKNCINLRRYWKDLLTNEL